MQAIEKMVVANPGSSAFSEEQLAQHLALAYAPEPDLFYSHRRRRKNFEFSLMAIGLFRTLFHGNLLA